MAQCKGQESRRLGAWGFKVPAWVLWAPAFSGVMAFSWQLPVSACGQTTACISERGIHSQWKDLQFGIHHILWEAVPMVNAFTT